jgi:SAM-dependent methyltransferase
MSHPEQLAFVDDVRAAFPRHFKAARVLEIGSLDINGTIRNRFEDCQYTGLDVAAGPGVDVVCQGQDYAAPDASFDTVISCEVMEHNPAWRETVKNMVRLTRPGGLVVMTCATWGRAEHGTARSDPGMSPLTVSKGWTYYRNLREVDLLEAGVTEGLVAWRFFRNWRSFDLYFVGVRRAFEPAEQRALDGLAARLRRGNFGTVRGLRRYLKAQLYYRAKAPPPRGAPRR